MILLIDLEAFPPGWTNSQRHNAHNATQDNMGIQFNSQPGTKTSSRANAPVQWDDDGLVSEVGDTTTKFILIGEFTDEEATRAYIVDIIADELGISTAAVDNKIAITEITHEQSQTLLYEDAIEWSERTNGQY